MNRRKHNGRLTRTKYNGTKQVSPLIPYTTVGQHRNNPRGLYEPTMRDTIFQLARFGHTNKEIAEVLNIGLSTLDGWTRSHPEVRIALDDGRVYSGLGYLDSLARRAHGYGYTEEKVESREVWNKELQQYDEVVTMRTVTKKQVLPNVTALIYLLKVRYGDKYSDVVKAQIEANVTFNMHKQPDLSLLTADERKLVRGINIKQLTALFDDHAN